jgi:hypothetical protein
MPGSFAIVSKLVDAAPTWVARERGQAIDHRKSVPFR